MKKKTAYLYLLVFIATISLLSCSETTPYGEQLKQKFYLKADKKSISLNGKEPVTLSISAPEDLSWFFSDYPSWIDIDIYDYWQWGNAQLTISANEENPQSTSRQGVIQFWGDKFDLWTSVTINQEGTYLKTNQESIEFSVEGGSETIIIDANAVWEINYLPWWISCNEMKGDQGKTSIEITSYVNNTATSKEDEIIFRTKNGVASSKIIVKQPEVKLAINQNSFTFTPSKGEASVNISSNTTWNAYSYDSWCSVSPSSGKGDDKLTIEVSPNTSDYTRSTTIVVSSGSVSRSITITQSPEPKLNVAEDNIHFTYKEGKATFAISSNIDWTISCDQNWCSLSQQTGSNNRTITVSVSENPLTTSRNATLTITGSGITRKITITQDGETRLSVSNNNINFKYTGGSYTFSVYSNNSWSASSNANWCEIGVKSGTNNGTVIITVPEYTNTSSDRSATITLTSGSKTCTVKVTQEKKPISNLDIDDYSNDTNMN